MKKVFQIFILLLLASMGLHAQNIDANAKKILDETSEKLSKNNTFYLKFSYLYSIPGQKSKSQTGEVYAAGDKYHLTLPDVSQIFDGNKVYTITNDDKEITASNKEDGESLSPTNILNLYKKDFNISSGGIKYIHKKKCNLITLTPTNTKKSKSITLAISNKKLVQVTEKYNDGSSLTLTVTQFLENLIVNKALLSFDKSNYKGYTYTEL